MMLTGSDYDNEVLSDCLCNLDVEVWGDTVFMRHLLERMDDIKSVCFFTSTFVAWLEQFHLLFVLRFSKIIGYLQGFNIIIKKRCFGSNMTLIFLRILRIIGRSIARYRIFAIKLKPVLVYFGAVNTRFKYPFSSSFPCSCAMKEYFFN